MATVLVHPRCAARRRAALERAASGAGTPLREDGPGVERLRRKGNVYALALVRRRDDRLDPAADHVLLLAPSHFGNVGTALRSMVAFGLHDLALAGGEVDPWSAHVLRASVGLRLAARCRRYPDVAGYLCEHPGRRHYLFQAGAPTELSQVRFAPPATLAFGPEWPSPAAGAPALPGAERVAIGRALRVESLNLAVAVSLAAYHLSATRLAWGTGARRGRPPEEGDG